MLREGAQDSVGLRIGHLDSPWGKFVAPVADDAGSRTLVFGGYRWRNDVALEAAFATAEASYALTPAGAAASACRSPGRRTARRREAGTPTSIRAGRSAPASRCTAGSATRSPTSRTPTRRRTLTPSDLRRTRDGVNYGVGLRYDVTPALGLRLEYARFGRFAGETVGSFLPETDQVQFGVQFRF